MLNCRPAAGGGQQFGQRSHRSLEEEHQQRPHLAGISHFPALPSQQVEEGLQLFGRVAAATAGFALIAVHLGEFPRQEIRAEGPVQVIAGHLRIGGLGRVSWLDVDVHHPVLPRSRGLGGLTVSLLGVGLAFGWVVRLGCHDRVCAGPRLGTPDQLALTEVAVTARSADQQVVVALINDPSVLQHHDQIGLLHG